MKQKKFDAECELGQRTLGKIIYYKGDNTANVFINGGIEAPEEYIEVNNLLNSVGEGYNINFFINSNGGLVETGIELAYMVQESRANTTAIITHECCSSATYLFMKSKNHVVYDCAYMLIHSFATSYDHTSITRINKLITKDLEFNSIILNNIYGGFLTKKEIKEVSEGREMYMYAPEIRKRIEKIKEERNK